MGHVPVIYIFWTFQLSNGVSDRPPAVQPSEELEHPSGFPRQLSTRQCTALRCHRPRHTYRQAPLSRARRMKANGLPRRRGSGATPSSRTAKLITSGQKQKGQRRLEWPQGLLRPGTASWTQATGVRPMAVSSVSLFLQHFLYWSDLFPNNSTQTRAFKVWEQHSNYNCMEHFFSSCKAANSYEYSPQKTVATMKHTERVM